MAHLVKEHSDRYQRHPSLGYRSAPGEAAAEALGLLYRVRSSRELSAVFVQNLQFLEDYWITGGTDWRRSFAVEQFAPNREQ